MIGGIEAHPWIVHFPVALVTVGALFSVAYLVSRREWLRWTAPLLLSIALIGGGAAYFTGQPAQDRAEALGVPQAALADHEESGLWGLGLTALACLLSWATHARRRGVWVSSLIAVAAAVAILWTSHLGGKLVFIHGAGRMTGATIEKPMAIPRARTTRFKSSR